MATAMLDSKMGLGSKAGTFNDSMDMDSPKLDKYKEMMQRDVIYETNLMRLNFNKEVIAQKMASDGFPGTFVARFMKTQLASCAALQAKPKPASMAVPETEVDVEAEKRHLMEKLQHSMEAQKKRAAKLGKLSATVLFAESPLPTPRAISARVAAPIAAEIISDAEVGSLEARNLDFFQKLVKKKICEKEAQEAVLLNDPERRAVLREAEERMRVHEQTRLDHYAKVGAIYVKRAASASLLPVSRKVWDTKDPAAIAASIKKRRPRKPPSVDVKTDVKRMLRLTTKLMSRLTPLAAPTPIAEVAITEEFKGTRASK